MESPFLGSKYFWGLCWSLWIDKHIPRSPTKVLMLMKSAVANEVWEAAGASHGARLLPWSQRFSWTDKVCDLVWDGGVNGQAPCLTCMERTLNIYEHVQYYIHMCTYTIAHTLIMYMYMNAYACICMYICIYWYLLVHKGAHMWKCTHPYPHRQTLLSVLMGVQLSSPILRRRAAGVQIAFDALPGGPPSLEVPAPHMSAHSCQTAVGQKSPKKA